ncbi:MAG: hypothetical protein IPI13_17485 [Actinomycetales bacterium]|uniref:Uncharacterized protein n=1 Tax=Candidatus Phosphoribacter hodrii TaxID=2953743 RepID=A0A935ITS4_9MICO|nr:hypothetical protein [Candidatus Phosphoribacter hodrii]
MWAVVEDDDPGSATWVGRYGPFERVIESDAVTTAEGALSMARMQYGRLRLPTESIQARVPVRPDLDYRDPVILRRDRSGVGGTYADDSRPAPRVILGIAAGEVSGGRVAVDLGGAVISAACAVPGVTAGTDVRLLVHGNGATVLHAQDPAGTPSCRSAGSSLGLPVPRSLPGGSPAPAPTPPRRGRACMPCRHDHPPIPTAPTGCVWIIRAT